MRTIMLIKKLMRDSELSNVDITYDTETDKFVVNLSPPDSELRKKIQELLRKEVYSYENNIE